MRNRLILILLIAGSLPVCGQFQGENSSPLERVFLGGGMDLSIGSDFLLIGASPSLGYMLTNSTAAGFGITYQYIRFPAFNETANVFGYRFFVQQMLYRGIFLYAEWENRGFKYQTDTSRSWANSTYVGGGLYQPISDRAGFQAIVLYRVNTNRQQNYNVSPLVYRAGITYSPFRSRR